MVEPARSAGDNSRANKILFWGCFIALVTTSFAFFSRIYLCDIRFGSDFGIDKVKLGTLKGAGMWPFAISIILFSLVIDRIGYRVAMLVSFVCYVAYLVLACMAYAAIQGGLTGDELRAAQTIGYKYLYWGSIILALGNGTVEAFINPVVATMFSREKTKWLNILHAGWPGGLVLGGIITIAMSKVAAEGDWRLVLGIIAIPAVVYLVMLIGAQFPKSEREQAGVSYREMLAEFGAFGAMIGFGLIFMELGNTFAPQLSSAAESIPALTKAVEEATPANLEDAKAALQTATEQASQDRWVFVGIATAIVTVAFGVYTQSFGRAIMAFLIIIMMPLATTELGTDGWITGLMESPMKTAGFNPGWVLVYTSAIMMVLRFFAGPIVHKLSPIGLLTVSSALAIAGLLALSKTGTMGLSAIFLAATLYGFGKTFFWPTMLGVTAEQCPKGGALTLNAISGIGMIAVGVLGNPFIGYLQENKASEELRANSAAVAQDVLKESSYMGRKYESIDPKVKDEIASLKKQEEKEPGSISAAQKEKITAVDDADTIGKLDALSKIAFFPAFMLACYVVLFLYFKAKGGYKAEVLTGHAAEDEKFTGGVAAPADA